MDSFCGLDEQRGSYGNLLYKGIFMLITLLFVLFVGLKITGFITASWWLVILWPLAVWLFVVLCFIVIGLIFRAKL